jgi:NADPH2:quinone reductase
VPEALREHLGPEGAHVVLDLVGGPTFAQAVRFAGVNGRVVALANVAVAPTTLDTRDFYPRNVTIHGFQLNGGIEHGRLDLARDLEALSRLVLDGRLVPHIHASLPLDEAERAHRLVGADETIGKVLLRPREG